MAYQTPQIRENPPEMTSTNYKTNYYKLFEDLFVHASFLRKIVVTSKCTANSYIKKNAR
jgi:hypothetical protein